MLEVIGTPWEPTPNVEAEDVARVPNPDAAEAEVVPKDPEIPESIARRMYIRKADIDVWRNRWCLGCRNIMFGKFLQSHTLRHVGIGLNVVCVRLTNDWRGCRGQTPGLRRQRCESPSGR